MSTNTRALRLSAFTILWAFAITLTPATAAAAQDAVAPQSQTPAADSAPDTTPQDRSHATQGQNTEEAWTILADTLHESKHADLRIQTLSALGTLGNNPRAEKLITEALQDSDVDVRSAAILAAGQTGNRNFISPLRSMLNDKEPQIVFVAASTLWKFNDHTGEDILLAVVDGDRSTNPSMTSGALHDASKKLHDPTALARIGVIQGASIFLGPVGLGIAAIDYMRKSGNDDAARLTAIGQLSEQQNPSARKTLIAALGDKNATVRAAAAKALGGYRDKTVSDALLPLFDYSKPPVRLFAAASYIRSTQQLTRPPASRKK
jgi:HEAT repeat protein